jgi:2-polyprenyl-3-methyl-5-hydroxy-6-metoxy-1,4-benzoquinol methylase
VRPVDAAEGAVESLRDSWSVLVGAQNRLHDVRERTHRNFDGGDAGHQWDHGLVVRHAVNYAVAARLASQLALDGPLVDVGAGAGGFSVWAAGRLRRPLVVVDQDPSHRELASRAFPDIDVHAQMSTAPQAPVVFCMEVIEHIARPEQGGFVSELAGLVAPGGMLVMSTPDESGYWGGWSGYPPHVATLDAGALSRLLQSRLPGWAVEVLRIDGPGFALSSLGRFGVPVANRVWGGLDSSFPRLTHELSFRISQLGRHRSDPATPDPSAFRVSPAEYGAGTGLVAMARHPGDATRNA